MYKIPKFQKTNIVSESSTEGETIENQIAKALSEGSKLGDNKPLIYTERKEGVRAETNIRTDRFEVAIEATSKIDKSYKASREERHKEPEEKKTEGQPTEGE